MSDNNYKILALDGGGSWALIQAAVLARIFGEKTQGRCILDHFDLVVATSGGSIVLGGLLENMTPQEIISLFKDAETRNSIFVKKPFYETIPNALGGVGPKYRTDAKLKGLNAVFKNGKNRTLSQMRAAISIGDRTIPELKKAHVVITAFDFDRLRAKFFRSDQTSKAAGANTTSTLGGATLTQAIHASTNAPVNYFDAPAKLELPGGVDLQMWDGGVGGYNNPVLAGVVEALASAKPPPLDTIRVLSIGTGSVFLPLASSHGRGDPVLFQEPGESSLLSDIRRMATAIVDDPPDAATFIAHMVLGGPLPSNSGNAVAADRVIRMNPLIQPVGDPAGGWRVPPGLTRNQFIRLFKLDMDATEQDDVDLIDALADAWLSDKAPNQPIRADGATLMCEIGHATYSDAERALKGWLAFLPCKQNAVDNSR